jgi:hypothetical protein
MCAPRPKAGGVNRKARKIVRDYDAAENNLLLAFPVDGK